MENWTGIVAALEHEAAELTTAANVIRRRFLVSSVTVSIVDSAPPVAASPVGRLAAAGARLDTKPRPTAPGDRPNRDEQRVAMIRALLRGGPMATKPIAIQLKDKKSIGKQALQRLLKAGDLERIGSGPRTWQWQLPGAKPAAPARTLADVVEPTKRPPATTANVEARDAAIVQQLRKAPTSTDALLPIMPREPGQTDETRATDLRNALTRLGYKKIITRAADGVKWTLAAQ